MEGKSRFYYWVKLPDKPSNASSAWEQLWSRKISENIYEICCIPFFLYDIALGDEVETDSDYWILKVIKPSGHFTFRVWLGNSTNPDTRVEVVNKVNDLDCLLEWYSNNLLAIDAPSNVSAKLIADFLHQKEKLGLLVYENGQ